MTSFILTTICALALSTSSVSPQSDTTDLFFVNAHNIVTLNGKELAGKTIKSYTVRRVSIGGRPVRAHIITTTDYQEPSSINLNGAISVPSITIREGASVDPLFLELLSDAGSANDAAQNNPPRIMVRPGSSSSLEDILYYVDGKLIDMDEFQKLDPSKIESITVLKDASATDYVKDLIAQGKLDRSAEGKSVILVRMKTASK